MLKRHLLTLIAVTALLAASADAASAQSHVLKFRGKTREGTKVSFALNGPWIDKFTTLLPATCISAQGGVPRVDFADWTIPYKYRVGYKAQVKYGDPTRYYTITTRRRGNRITGKLQESYSLLDTDGWGGWMIRHCLATGNFSLRGH